MSSNAVDDTPISPVREGMERRNSLEKHLQHRPEPQDLKNRHILLDTAAAPYAHLPFQPHPYPMLPRELAGPAARFTFPAEQTMLTRYQ